jgi:uncharacterized protein
VTIRGTEILKSGDFQSKFFGMKKIQFTLFLVVTSILLQAQVTIKPLSQTGFEQRIRNYIDTIKVVDTHEHLMNPKGIPNSGMFDFMLLFHHYADDDIKSSGMSKPTFNRLLTDSLTVLQKWEILKPYWDKSFNTAYNRVVLLTVDKLFGIKELNDKTVVELSNKIQEAYKTDWFNTVLKDKCNIEFIINDSGDRSFGDTSMFRYTQHFNYFRIDSKEVIDNLAKQNNVTIHSLDELENSLKIEFEKAFEDGILTLKTTAAYFRSLSFEDVSKENAEKVFKLIQKSEKSLPSQTIKPLSDYMMHRMLDLADKYNTPIQIHTGLQAGDGNYIENSNPTHLANLFLKYRNVQFILFHGGYPFGSELASLAKNFRNVYIDLCWLYIISPSYSERYLHEWLETVPANKIMGFGGDYHNVENVYGHLLFAKEILENVLIEKVESGYFSEKEALKIASMILHDNAVNLFQLKH